MARNVFTPFFQCAALPTLLALLCQIRVGVFGD